MKIAILGSLVFFLLALFALLAVFLVYPLFLYLHPPFRHSPQTPVRGKSIPRISLIVVAYNAVTLIENKARNCLALDYPSNHLDIFLCSDGSSDQTVELMRPFVSARVHLLSYPLHRGKATVINDIAAQCPGDLLLFSDVDAILEPDSLKILVRHFSDDTIGGVSGLRVIRETERSHLSEPQRNYIFADSMVKSLESRIGSTTSNDGKLYLIRRNLFRPISPAATDDLFTCLNIVSQGKRFIFEPRARAYIEKPSQTMTHEIHRRRRIVCRSLYGIWLMRALLNPKRFKSFAVGLFINKVVRRTVPFLLIILFISSLLLAIHYPFVWLPVGVQLLIYFLAIFQLITNKINIRVPRVVNRTSVLSFYFCLGTIGTFLGVLDFLRGERYEKWEPVKADSPD